MQLNIHEQNGGTVVTVEAAGICIHNAADALDLLGNVYYQGYDKLVLFTTQLTPDFFDLKTKLAGEILQKFSNYRVRLMIVGNLDPYDSDSLRDFVRESNRGKLIGFADTFEAAMENLR